MSLIVLERPNGGGPVTVNTALVREVQATTIVAPHAVTRLIFDEHDHFEVLGDLPKVAEAIGLHSL